MKTLHSLVKEKQVASWILMLVVTGLMALMLASCDEDAVNADNLAEDQESVQSEDNDDFFIDDAEDIGFGLLEEETSSGGKVAEETDERVACAVVARTGSIDAGTITIDFGDGCTGPRGNVRQGTIVINFTGRRSVPGSSWTVEFVDYSINGVSISGTITVTNISENDTLVLKLDMDNGVITWPDGSIARRRFHRIRTHERDENNLLDRLIVFGTAEGNHRNGRGFQIEILEPLVYNRRCVPEGVFIPVEGVKLIKHGQRQITVDYGDGRCDNTVTITNKNGRSWQYTVE